MKLESMLIKLQNTETDGKPSKYNLLMEFNFKSISTHKCKNRPGVATMTSGEV